MNYLLEIISQPEFVVKFAKKNPLVDNDLDLGNFVRPELISQPLIYLDAKNGKISFSTLVKYDAITAVSGGILVSRRVRTIIEKNFQHEVQFFDAIVEFQGKITDMFSVINIYTKIECYDMDKSVYEKSPVDGSYEFERIVPVSFPLEEHDIEYHLVRSSHDNRVVVSEKFKELMEMHDINSFKYEGEYAMEW